MLPWGTDLCKLNLRPPLHAEDDISFWDDEYISRRILEVHLDPDTDSATRRPQDVEASANWIASKLPRRARVLDAGCGPGLYAQRLASKGMSVVGLDINRASLGHASMMARGAGLSIDYRHGDLRDADLGSGFDAALLIYGMLGSLNDGDRDLLLDRLHRCIRPGGMLIFDVMTARNFSDRSVDRDWYFSPRGFWSPDPHFVLQRRFEYDGGIFLHRTIVLEDRKDVAVYDMWNHTYDVGSITDALCAHGFEDIEIFSDLAGTPYRDDSEWLGVCCRVPIR